MNKLGVGFYSYKGFLIERDEYEKNQWNVTESNDQSGWTTDFYRLKDAKKWIDKK